MEDNDLSHVVLPFCDVLLSGLTISPGSLAPTFDPYNTDYTVAAGVSRITVVPEIDHNSFVQFIDENGQIIEDADRALPGHQVDFSSDLSAIRIRVVSGDGRATRTYTIAAQTTGTCTSVGAVANAADNPGLVSDCEALLAARDILAGTATLDWSASTPIDQWEGVTLAGIPQRVTELVLIENGLTGTIPAELGSLSRLRQLYLHNNRLTGKIPSELGDLGDLQWMSLSANELTGEIPVTLGRLTKLEELHLDSNELTGEIPVELSKLTELRVLELKRNRLEGAIPVELGSLSNLEWLQLAHNQFSGPIPTELGSLSKLHSLLLSFNQLSGPIPPELGSLDQLWSLMLTGNQLTGGIPRDLNNLSNLRRLDLGFNG